MVSGMATHALDLLDALCLISCDVLGFSLGGMVAQQIGTRPPVGNPSDDSGRHCAARRRRHHPLETSLARHLGDPTLKGYAVLQKIFFAGSPSSQAAGGAFIERLAQRKEDLDTPSGSDVAAAQIAAFREWEQPTATGFADLKGIQQPTLVVNGIDDEQSSRSRTWAPVDRRTSEHCTSRVSGLRTRIAVSVSRVVYASGISLSDVELPLAPY